DVTQLIFDTADDLAGSRVLDFLDLPGDQQVVANFHSGLCAHIQSDGISADVRHQAINRDRVSRKPLCVLIELDGNGIYGFVVGFSQESLAKVAAPHVIKPSSGRTASPARTYQRGAGTR